MSFARYLSLLYDLFVFFFGSSFFVTFGLGFFAFFCLIMSVKVVWFCVRSHRATY